MLLPRTVSQYYFQGWFYISGKQRIDRVTFQCEVRLLVLTGIFWQFCIVNWIRCLKILICLFFQPIIIVPIKLEMFLQLSELLIKCCIRITERIPGNFKRTKDAFISLMANTDKCKGMYKTLHKLPQSHTTGGEISSKSLSGNQFMLWSRITNNISSLIFQLMSNNGYWFSKRKIKTKYSCYFWVANCLITLPQFARAVKDFTPVWGRSWFVSSLIQ